MPSPMPRNNEIQKKSEHKIAFPTKGPKCTYDHMAFSRRFLKILKFERKSDKWSKYYNLSKDWAKTVWSDQMLKI